MYLLQFVVKGSKSLLAIKSLMKANVLFCCLMILIFLQEKKKQEIQRKMAPGRKILFLSIICACLILNLAASSVSEDYILDDVIAQLKQVVQNRNDIGNILPKEHSKMLPIAAEVDGAGEETYEFSKRNRRLPCILRDSSGRCRRYKKLGLWGKRNF